MCSPLICAYVYVHMYVCMQLEWFKIKVTGILQKFAALNNLWRLKWQSGV